MHYRILGCVNTMRQQHEKIIYWRQTPQWNFTCCVVSHMLCGKCWHAHAAHWFTGKGACCAEQGHLVVPAAGSCGGPGGLNHRRTCACPITHTAANTDLHAPESCHVHTAAGVRCRGDLGCEPQEAALAADGFERPACAGHTLASNMLTQT